MSKEKRGTSKKQAKKLVEAVASVVLAGTVAFADAGTNAAPLTEPAQKALIQLKPFQEPIFWDDDTGVLVLHWSRQIGKSYVLAAWSVKRLLNRPGRLITVLSNSRDNGKEFVEKVKEVCRLAGAAFEDEDLSPSEFFEDMQYEVRIKVDGKVGRIKVLAANPRTARGFSGDLILDEFAFHENSAAIWDAAEPIISSNPDYICRIASTGNGKFNMFYRMVAGAKTTATTTNPAGLCESSAGFIVSRVARSAAYILGQKIYDPKSRQPITPEQAFKAALDKASYRQNYELAFNDEAGALLAHELITSAQYGDDQDSECFICEDEWSPSVLQFLASLPGPLNVGVDVGRKRDLTVITVGERVGGIGGVIMVRAVLRMEAKRTSYQLKRLCEIMDLPNAGRAFIDFTGVGVGLTDDAQDIYGVHRVVGIHFASREVRDEAQAAAAERSIDRNAKPDTALVTELMGLDMLKTFEDARIRIPREGTYYDALRKPQRIAKANGEVRIAAESDEDGHADEFWSLALLIKAFKTPPSVVTSTNGIRLGGGRAGRPRFTPRRLGGRVRSEHSTIIAVSRDDGSEALLAA